MSTWTETVSISQNSLWSWHATGIKCSMYLGPFQRFVLTLQAVITANETRRD